MHHPILISATSWTQWRWSAPSHILCMPMEATKEVQREHNEDGRSCHYKSTSTTREIKWLSQSNTLTLSQCSFEEKLMINFLHSSTRFTDRDSVFPFFLILEVTAGPVSMLCYPSQSNHPWQLWKLQWSPSRTAYACPTISVKLSVKQGISGCRLCGSLLDNTVNSFCLCGSTSSLSSPPP